MGRAKSKTIGVDEARVVEALSDLGLDACDVASLIGAHPYEVAAMIAERDRQREYERGRMLALAASNARLLREVKLLSRELAEKSV